LSERDRYPAGVPCWVETLQPDPQRAVAFYCAVFGWDCADPGTMPGGGTYHVARYGGRDVAGIGATPAQGGPSAPVWMTYVRVERIEDTLARVRAAGGSVLVDALDAPPAGRLAVIADPDGVSLCLWEAHSREGAQRINEAGAWAMSALLTANAERATAFYGSVFDWQTEPFAGVPGVVLFRLPGYVGGLPQQPAPRDVVAVMAPLPSNGVPPHWSVEFWVADAAAAAATAERLGGRVLVAPHRELVFERAVIADPAGAVFTISQLV
jgi:predicted enzyme related to lactoylglutathione lyase